MNRYVLFLAALLINATMLVYGVNYCASSAWGYAGNVTGGGNATPVLVSTYDDLRKELMTDTGEPKVIIVTKDIEFHKYIPSPLSNITLLALPGVRLITNETNPNNSGLLQFEGGRNIIIRNITFDGAGIYDSDGKDCLTAKGAYHMWVDHCDFQDGMDGNFDIHMGADSITVTWCRFRYFGDPSQSEHDHRFSNLIGSNNEDIPADGVFNVTFANCWWDEGCAQRMTRCRHSELHFLNCYWNSSVSSYYVGPEASSCYFEGCKFEGLANDNNKVWTPFFESPDFCTFVNCEGNIPVDAGVVAPPTYPYDHLTPAQTKQYVIDANCGAGATLLVNTHGRVFSPCEMLRTDAIFYWQMSGTTAPANGSTLPATGGSVYVGSKDASKSFNTESASYADSVPDYMKAKDDKGLKATANAEYLTLKLSDSSFRAGDTLILCGYLPWKVSSSLANTSLIDSIATGSAKTDYSIGQLILPVDADSLVLSRNRSLGTGLSSIIVCRQPRDPEEEARDLVLHSIMWNISDDDFKNLDTIKSEMAIRQLHLIANEKAVMVVDANRKSLDGYSFTHRLKTAASGKSESRNLWFDVKGDCTVHLYVAGANNSEERTVNIAVGAFDNVVATVPGVPGSPAKQTFMYVGEKNRIFIYGADGGINIYGIQLTYPEEEAIDQIVNPQSSIQKFIKDGQLLILRGDKTYTIDGRLVK